MVSQSDADDFASFLGFQDYGARIKVGNKTVVITCDGVGTKLYLADHFKKWDTVGIDLVAMCVNDLLCCGATPRAFMDYYAVENLDLVKSKEIIKGIKRGCQLARCNLVGGETAQLQGMFSKVDSFDLAGFALGERENWNYKSTRTTPKVGDYLIGIPSSGLHSNGFTQIREAMEPQSWMLTPTRIYTPEILSSASNIKRCAHITGGGIVRNLKRILNGRTYHLFDKKFEGIWKIVSKALKLNREEMINIFNCGWGMILVTDTLDLGIKDAVHIGNVT